MMNDVPNDTVKITREEILSKRIFNKEAMADPGSSKIVTSRKICPKAFDEEWPTTATKAAIRTQATPRPERNLSLNPAMMFPPLSPWGQLVSTNA